VVVGKGPATDSQREETNMAIQAQQQQYQRKFVPVDQLPVGTGESSKFKKDITGVLLGIESRDGMYEFKDPNTGEVIEKPNNYIAHFADGSMFGWPTYIDKKTGKVCMWDKFEEGLELRQIIQQSITIHLWRDERNFTHLKVVEQTQTQDENIPWE
jgi:hypothetical protein